VLSGIGCAVAVLAIDLVRAGVDHVAEEDGLHRALPRGGDRQHLRRIVRGLTFFVAKDGIPRTALRTYRVTKS